MNNSKVEVMDLDSLVIANPIITLCNSLTSFFFHVMIKEYSKLLESILVVDFTLIFNNEKDHLYRSKTEALLFYKCVEL